MHWGTFRRWQTPFSLTTPLSIKAKGRFVDWHRSTVPYTQSRWSKEVKPKPWGKVKWGLTLIKLLLTHIVKGKTCICLFGGHLKARWHQTFVVEQRERRPFERIKDLPGTRLETQYINTQMQPHAHKSRQTQTHTHSETSFLCVYQWARGEEKMKARGLS